MKMQSKDLRATLMVGDAAKILKRCYFLQRECVLAQAGWIPGTWHWETKVLWPEFLWQDSQIATGLRERVLELRYPERRIEPGDDAELIELWRLALRDAPSDLAFASGMIDSIKPFFRKVYARYLSVADALDDAPTIRILRQAILDIDDQIGRLREARLNFEGVYSDKIKQAADAWKNQVAIFLERLTGEALVAEILPTMPDSAPLRSLSRPFAIARKGCRDPRFSASLFPWPNSYDPSWRPSVGMELQMLAAVQHVNEVWAAEMAAAVLFDLADEGPPEFLTDAARWCFDEIRHCRMGYTRLGEWGFKKSEIPMGSFAYDAGAELDALGRLGIIFYFETTYIGTKPERARGFLEFGDRTSSHDMDFDWADELIHTHYGKKWLDHFLRSRGGKISMLQIKEAGEAAVARIREESNEPTRKRVFEVYAATLKRAGELAVVGADA